jgi:hypothetical protein
VQDQLRSLFDMNVNVAVSRYGFAMQVCTEIYFQGTVGCFNALVWAKQTQCDRAAIPQSLTSFISNVSPSPALSGCGVYNLTLFSADGVWDAAEIKAQLQSSCELAPPSVASRYANSFSTLVHYALSSSARAFVNVEVLSLGCTADSDNILPSVTVFQDPDMSGWAFLNNSMVIFSTYDHSSYDGPTTLPPPMRAY